jgi:predicted nucleic acid-binding protein
MSAPPVRVAGASGKTGSAFFDTNVILYLLSADTAKADRADALLAGGGAVSVQVLNEFVSVARRKVSLDWAEIDEVLGVVRAVCMVQALTVETHEAGLRLARRLQLSVYDAMIVSAALQCDCRTLWTEDMQDGLLIDGSLRIRNPFA